MLSLSLGCFIPLLRHRPFITTAAVTLISNGSNQVRGAHGSSSGSSFSSSEPPVNGNGQRRNSFVWVKVPIDDQKKAMTSIVVEEMTPLIPSKRESRRNEATHSLLLTHLIWNCSSPNKTSNKRNHHWTLE